MKYRVESLSFGDVRERIFGGVKRVIVDGGTLILFGTREIIFVVPVALLTSLELIQEAD